MTMPRRPLREDIPDEASPCDILYELRLLAYDFARYRYETNGDLGWLRSFRSKVNDGARILLALVPVVVAAALAWMVASA